MLMSAYLWTGEHLSVRNLSILDAIGELTKHQGLNWLLEMDAQLTPEELSATGWLADVGGPFSEQIAPLAVAWVGVGRSTTS